MKKSTLIYLAVVVIAGMALFVQYLMETHQSYFGTHQMSQGWGTRYKVTLLFNIQGLQKEKDVRVLTITGDRVETFEVSGDGEERHFEAPGEGKYEYKLEFEKQPEDVPDQILVEWTAGREKYVKRLK